MTTPGPTPEDKALKSVLAVSRFNGWTVVVVAALGILLTLAMGDLVGTLVGGLVLLGGFMEVRGHRKLKRRDPEGMAWLVRSQLLLLGVILAYCASRLGSFDADTAMANLTPDMEAVMKEAGLERADILSMVRTTFFVSYVLIAVVTIFYQGGMALFYRRKTGLVTAALVAPPEPTNYSVL